MRQQTAIQTSVVFGGNSRKQYFMSAVSVLKYASKSYESPHHTVYETPQMVLVPSTKTPRSERVLHDLRTKRDRDLLLKEET
jgi:hypothetical protein